MKTIKCLLTVSVLVAAGTTQSATVATWSSLTLAPIILLPTDYGIVSLVKTSSGTGSAVLDDSGTFTITAHAQITTTVQSDNDFDFVDTLTGTWDGTTFTATGGTRQYTGCIDHSATTACAALASGGVLPALASGSLTLTGGSISAASRDPLSHATITYAYTFGAGTSAVPVPATAWLFGSGVLGLVSAARRRNKSE